MKIEWNKVTWYSKLAAIAVGIGIFVLGIYIGSLYQKVNDAMEIAGQLQYEQPPIIEKKTVAIYAFDHVGNIKNVATGDVEADTWVLVYEEPGSPALAKELVFTTNSRCVFDVMPTFCNTARFEQGQRVRAMGREDGTGKIVIERLEVLR